MGEARLTDLPIELPADRPLDRSADLKPDRRPLTSRNSRWAMRAAQSLAGRGVSPNAISLGSVACATGALLAFLGVHALPNPVARAALLLVAAACMQLRLVCNLLDGMVAVEAGAGVGKFGEIYNDFPDRVADVLIFVGVGLVAGPTTGTVLALAAVIGCLFTAYVRVLGKSIGARSHFAGPMAKQHRMAVLTAACVGGCVVVFVGHWLHVWMQAALAVVIGGCAATVINRLRKIAHDLAAK